MRWLIHATATFLIAFQMERAFNILIWRMLLKIAWIVLMFFVVSIVLNVCAVAIAMNVFTAKYAKIAPGSLLVIICAAARIVLDAATYLISSIGFLISPLALRSLMHFSKSCVKNRPCALMCSGSLLRFCG